MPRNETSGKIQIEDLDGFMSVFRDIRMAAVIIADSIRTRERNALRGTGLLVQQRYSKTATKVSDPARCPLGMDVFFEPTVVSKLCGHGMHEGCAKTFLPSSDESCINVCPICRLPLTRSDLIELKGVLPTADNCAAWKTIILTQPWETDKPLATPHARGTIEGCAERLLVMIKSLFTIENDFAAAMKQILEVHNEVQKKNRSEKQHLQRMRKEIVENQRKLDDAEFRLSSTVCRGQSVVMRCADNIWQQQEHLTMKLDLLVRRQLKLDRINSEIKANEESLQERTDEFEKKREVGKKALIEVRKSFAADRNENESNLLEEDARDDMFGYDDIDVGEGSDNASILAIEDIPRTPSSSLGRMKRSEIPQSSQRPSRKAKKLRIE